MKLSILFLFLTVCGIGYAQYCAHCHKIGLDCYKLSYLFNLPAYANINSITKFGVVRNTNMLIFSFNTGLLVTENYRTRFINIKHKDINGIITLQKDYYFGSFDIDQENEVVYLGGEDGIYALYSDNILSYIGARGKGYVFDISYQKQIYFASTGGYVTMRNLSLNTDIRVEKLIVNNDNFTVFQGPSKNFTAVYVTNGDDTILLRKSGFRGYVKNVDNVVYAYSKEGIFKIILPNYTRDLKEVKILQQSDIAVTAMAFDIQNNILFAADRAVFKLTLEAGDCGVTYLEHCL